MHRATEYWLIAIYFPFIQGHKFGILYESGEK